MIWRLCTSILVILCASCLPIVNGVKPSVAGNPTATPAFCGISKYINGEEPANLLIIHGIGWHESYNYDKALRKALREKLTLGLPTCSRPDPIVNPEDPYNVYGGVQRCVYKRGDKVALRTYTLLWSPMTMPYKVGALGYDWDDPHHRNRVFINRLLKRDLIDQSFSDAVLYAGALSEAMKYSVRQAVCAAITDETDLRKPCSKPPMRESEFRDLFIVTHSLGSIMLFETLGETAKTEGQRAVDEVLIRRVRLVGMMANQLPLVGLSRLTRPPENGRWSPPMPALPELLSKRAGLPPIPVAAFTDINDLLSYPIPENWKVSLFPDVANDFEFVNYPVVNVRGAILGIFANPASAHSGYWNNDKVVHAIAWGYNCRKDQP